MSKHVLKFAVVLVSALLLLGSNRLAAVPQGNSETSDSAITSSIQAKLFQDPALKMQDIRVSTQQGVVTQLTALPEERGAPLGLVALAVAFLIAS